MNLMELWFLNVFFCFFSQSISNPNSQKGDKYATTSK